MAGAMRAGLAATFIVIMPPMIGFSDEAVAQCAARTQTGLGTNAVALAQRCGTTVGDLRRANPGRSLNKPGLLNVPGGTNGVTYDTLNNDVAPRQRLNATRQRPIALPAAPARQNPQAVPIAAGGAYAIRPGDTLSAIAGSLGVSLRSIVAVNPGIDPNRLMVGQRIALPETATR